MLPVTAALAQPLTLPAGAILSAAVLNADGSVRWPPAPCWRSLALAAGAKLAAGWRITAMTFLATTEWPAGIALPNLPNVPYGSNLLTLARNVIPPRGALIPSGANVKLNPGVQYVDLRPVVNDAQGRVCRGAHAAGRLAVLVDAPGRRRRPGRRRHARHAIWRQARQPGAGRQPLRHVRLRRARQLPCGPQQGADDIGMPWLAGTVIDEQFIIDNFWLPVSRVDVQGRA